MLLFISGWRPKPLEFEDQLIQMIEPFIRNLQATTQKVIGMMISSTTRTVSLSFQSETVLKKIRKKLGLSKGNELCIESEQRRRRPRGTSRPSTDQSPNSLLKKTMNLNRLTQHCSVLRRRNDRKVGAPGLQRSAGFPVDDSRERALPNERTTSPHSV